MMSDQHTGLERDWEGNWRIDDLKDLQRDLNLLDVHVVWLGLGGFVIAHTDEERAEVAATGLEDCEVHTWLVEQDGPPARKGFYIVTPHEVDQYSESYRVARFDFTPLCPDGSESQGQREADLERALKATDEALRETLGAVHAFARGQGPRGMELAALVAKAHDALGLRDSVLF